MGDSPTPSVGPGSYRTEVKSLKASFNQEQLDQAVLLYSPDLAVRRALKGFGVKEAPSYPGRQDQEEPPIMVPKWHEEGKKGALQARNEDNQGHKRRSPPLRKFGSNSSGSGMRYQPREPQTDSATTLPNVDSSERSGTVEERPPPRIKSRSQPFRRRESPSGLTIPLIETGHMTGGESSPQNSHEDQQHEPGNDSVQQGAGLPRHDWNNPASTGEQGEPQGAHTIMTSRWVNQR